MVKGACRDFGGKSEGKRLLVRRRRRWEENIQVYFMKSGREQVKVKWLVFVKMLNFSRSIKSGKFVVQLRKMLLLREEFCTMEFR